MGEEEAEAARERAGRQMVFTLGKLGWLGCSPLKVTLELILTSSSNLNEEA